MIVIKPTLYVFAGPNYNLEIIRKAKEAGFFIYCFYVITRDPEINIQRVKSRAEIGGHDVPEDKIVSRYHKALDKMKEVLPLCDIVNVYDNSIIPYRIFKKRKDVFYYQDSELWSYNDIYKLTGIDAQERDLNRF